MLEVFSESLCKSVLANLHVSLRGSTITEVAKCGLVTSSVYPRVNFEFKGLDHLLPKFEHIFVAAITFFPFLLCRYF